VADRLRIEEVDSRGRGKDQRSREESGELRTSLAKKTTILAAARALFGKA